MSAEAARLVVDSRRGRGCPPHRDAAILEALRTATSARELAIRFGVSLEAMRQVLRRLRARGLVRHGTLGGWLATGRAR